MNITDKLAAALRDLIAYEDDRPAAGTRGAEVYAAAEALLAEYDAARASHRDPTKNYPATNTGD